MTNPDRRLTKWQTWRTDLHELKQFTGHPSARHLAAVKTLILICSAYLSYRLVSRLGCFMKPLAIDCRCLLRFNMLELSMISSDFSSVSRQRPVSVFGCERKLVSSSVGVSDRRGFTAFSVWVSDRRGFTDFSVWVSDRRGSTTFSV